MPLTEAGFLTDDGLPDHQRLVAFGPTLPVTVRYLPRDDSSPETSEAAPALIDTGADESCIDADLAKRLSLPTIDSEIRAGVSGPATHPVYIAAIDIPALGWRKHGRFAGVSLAAGGAVHSVILGRDFLSSTIMIYDGLRAQVTLSSPASSTPQ